MNQVSRTRLFKKGDACAVFGGAVLWAALIPVVSLLAGCRPVVTTGGDIPVTTERLAGRHLVDIHRELSWTFSDTAVVIQNQGEPIPPDLTQELLGDWPTAQRIEATWRFDKNTNTLRLTDAKADGKDIGAEIIVPIQPAGQIRFNLGTRQYNVFRDSTNVP